MAIKRYLLDTQNLLDGRHNNNPMTISASYPLLNIIKYIMIQRIIFTALVAYLAAATNVVAFSPATNQVRTTTTLLYSATQRTTDVIPPITGDYTDDDVTCYITNDEEIVTENEKPHVVCTSEPDDVSTANCNITYISFCVVYKSHEEDYSRHLISSYIHLVYKYIASVCMV